ncbi:MAG: DMT family transporter [Gemmatimonadales bacterium]
MPNPVPDRQTVRPAFPLPAAADLGMLTVCLIWGLNFSVTKLAIEEIPPLAFTAVRFATASALLWVILRMSEGEARMPRGVLLRLVVLGILGNTFYQLAFILGLARTTATNSALILAMMPMTVAVLSGILGHERITPRMRWGISFGTLGVGLVIATRGVGFSGGTLAGDLLTLLGVFAWAAYTIGLRAVPPGVSSLRVTTVATIAGTPALVLAGLPQSLALDWAAVSREAWAGLGYATLLSLVVAYLLWNRSVKAVGGTRTAIYMCVTPLVAATGAWAMLGERAHPLQAIGAGLIVAGVLMTRTSEK